MVKSFLLILFFLFAVDGICNFIYMLRMAFFRPASKVKNYALLLLKNNCAIAQMNFLWQKIKWHGNNFAVGIIAVSDTLDISEYLKCKEFAKDKNIILCNSDTLLEFIKKQEEECYDSN